MPRSALMNVMVGAALKAGRGLARDFGEVANLQVSMKGPGDFVSQADLKAETALRKELERVRPGYGFLMEESGDSPGTDPLHRWIVDPLDGTTNFLHSIPIFAISIALERQGEIVAGVIYNPVMDELFTAERGSGAFLNDRRIRVAQRRELGQSVVTCGIPHQGRGHRGQFVADVTPMMTHTAGVRRTGSAALDLAWVAAGRFDAFFERGLSYWDFAAGMLIVTEAGGYATDISGSGSPVKTGNVLASNPELHPQLAQALNAAKAPASA
ncbi:inositol monophosphatase family protein [Lutibaculum baratangense]|uniref:Inositol-1-monophosphatase n=1 Tax=Lutibaculum baratangense AMV1 TaxID=631454 RepID=V4TBA0_9HYPH|nr:inositol monophosphatase family protein [Lutibaculum baratangense]ESR23678.1 Inositol-1-monophosphatase [Lutibaculum baratangense AMV1]